MTFKNLSFVFICAGIFSLVPAMAEKGHDHDKPHAEDNKNSKDKGHDHSEGDSGDKHAEEGHSESDEHGHEEKEHAGHEGEKEGEHAGESHSEAGHSEGDEHGHDEKGHAGHGEEKEGAHGDEKSASVGPGLAILEAHETRGIKLNEKAAKRLRLEFSPARASNKGFEVPSASVIGQRGENLLYVKRDDWLTMVKVEVLSRTKDRAFIKSENLKAEEQVVSHNAGLVRLSHLEAFGASGDGHGH